MTELRPVNHAPPASDALPTELAAICAAMESPQMQGQPLVARDYVLLCLVTVVLPLALILIGSSL